MKETSNLIPYRVKDDEGDYYFYSDCPLETVKAFLKVLYTLDSYSYTDELKGFIEVAGFEFKEPAKIDWVIL